MIAIAVVLAAKAVRKVGRISRSVESLRVADLQRPVSGVRVRFGRLKRIALQIGTAFA
jgi:hypothetical protein